MENNQQISVQQENRQTNFGKRPDEQQQIDALIDTQLHQPLDFRYFIFLIQKYPSLRDQSKFMQKLFYDTQLVETLINCLLNPESMIENEKNKLKVQKQKFHGITYHISEFMKDNCEFYQLFYISLQKHRRSSRISTQLKQQQNILQPQQNQNQLNNLRRNSICKIHVSHSVSIQILGLKMDLWFKFLQQSPKEHLAPALGYFNDVFIPLIKYQYSECSRVNQYFQQFQQEQEIIRLIDYFSIDLLDKIMKFTHLNVIFKAMFELVLVSLSEQEWKKSLFVLDQLLKSTIIKEMTSDSHIQNICIMTKQISNNINNDKDRKIFAFISAINKCNLPEAAIKRIKNFNIQHNKSSTQQQEVIEYNIKFVAQMVHIFYLLCKNNINKQVQNMKRLKQQVKLIMESINQLLIFFNSIQQTPLKFSSGQNICKIKIYKYQLLVLIKNCLLIHKQFGQEIPQLSIINCSQIVHFLIKCMKQNRWNNISQRMIQKIVNLLITPDFIKKKQENCVGQFLSFLMQQIIIKKYIFLNSTRMCSQGDYKTLQHICRRVAMIIQKTGSMQFPSWNSFVINKLKIQLQQSDRTSIIQLSQSADFQQLNQKPKDQSRSLEVDEIEDKKKIVNTVNLQKYWKTSKTQKNTLNKRHELLRSGSSKQLKVVRNVHKSGYEKPSPQQKLSNFRGSLGDEQKIGSAIFSKTEKKPVQSDKSKVQTITLSSEFQLKLNPLDIKCDVSISEEIMTLLMKKQSNDRTSLK